ncbi:sugar phosphate isomerase/epimerase family protein [Thermocatellispora tengchongensis]|uniref:sugar phosphate isomerase/epimerase family protein n=1 Tax=Thermocatellispora tengchongensis TaxID=1073253 RepID=UPI00363D0A60
MRAGTGRWDPLGRPASIAANYGSTTAFIRLVRDLGIEAVSSWYFDPGEPIDEELSHGRSVLAPDDHKAIAETIRPFAEFLAAAGGSRLVVRALPAAWRTGALTAGQIAVAGAGWNTVGAAAAEFGIGVTLHADCLSAAADDKTLAALLDATDPALVGLTIDTAELTLAGLDPVATYQRHAERVDHLHLKDTRHVDDAGERLAPHAEAAMMSAGGAREIERWFFECGTPGGLVDFPGLFDRLGASGYAGWAVFESEQTPNPSSSVMLNAWYAQHVLGC